MLRPGSPDERLITEAVIAGAEQLLGERDLAQASYAALQTTKRLVNVLELLGFPITWNDDS